MATEAEASHSRVDPSSTESADKVGRENPTIQTKLQLGSMRHSSRLVQPSPQSPNAAWAVQGGLSLNLGWLVAARNITQYGLLESRSRA
jgi:hypothetical protein